MSRTLSFRRLALAGSVMAVLTHAQTNVGSIFGHVTDASGAPIAGASVMIVNPATNETTRTITTGQGDYVFNSVRPATYRVSAEHPGFSQTVRTMSY